MWREAPATLATSLLEWLTGITDSILASRPLAAALIRAPPGVAGIGVDLAAGEDPLDPGPLGEAEIAVFTAFDRRPIARGDRPAKAAAGRSGSGSSGC